MIAVIPFSIVLILFIILYFISKGKYKDFIEPLDKKTYPLKDLLPIGLFIADKAKIKFRTNYNTRLHSKIAQLYGNTDSKYYLRIYWGNKIVYSLFTLIIMLFLMAASSTIDLTFSVLSLFFPIGIFFLLDSDLSRKVEKRQKMIKYEFPDFLNKLILLVNAGLTVPAAWEKIVLDGDKKGDLHLELKIAYNEIRSNKAQEQAYQDFAKRCRVPEITKFISVIIQNMKKGNSEMIIMLRLQSHECWEMRKNVTKQLGEEASTKLLFPMMIMLIAVFIIVLVPAIMQISNI